MLEKEFQTRFTQAIYYNMEYFFPKEGYVYHKISDMSLNLKPVDCFLITETKVFLFELKVCKNKKKVTPIKLLQGIQEKSLLNCHSEEFNHFGYIVILFDKHTIKNRKQVCFVPIPKANKEWEILDLIDKYACGFVYDDYTRTNRYNLFKLLK